MKRALLAIDLQYDFCNPKGTLFVNNSDEDVKQISNLINNHINEIDTIILSMDSHQPIHIAHQIYWKDKDGNHPELYSNIKSEDIQSGKWIAQYNQEEALPYLTRLEQDRSSCTIWPPHCIIGTPGWSIDETVFKAVEKWSIQTGNSYELINKGMHQSTEHYSIFKAAIELPEISETHFNQQLADKLNQFDQILIVGEAADFCVASSVKDLIERVPQIAPKLYILTDCMSYIIKNNAGAQAIFNRVSGLGAHFCLSTEI